jgi:dihydroxyacetone kinase
VIWLGVFVQALVAAHRSGREEQGREMAEVTATTVAAMVKEDLTQMAVALRSMEVGGRGRGTHSDERRRSGCGTVGACYHPLLNE